MALQESLLSQALELSPADKARLVNSLLNSLDQADTAIDKLWSKEAENRIEAYKNGKLKARSIEDVLSKYQ